MVLFRMYLFEEVLISIYVCTYLVLSGQVQLTFVLWPVQRLGLFKQKLSKSVLSLKL